MQDRPTRGWKADPTPSAERATAASRAEPRPATPRGSQKFDHDVLAFARLQSILDTVTDGIITVDAGGSIESFSKGAQRLFGYQEHEVMGQNVLLLLGTDTNEASQSRSEPHVTDFKRTAFGVARESIGIRKDGTTFPAEVGVGTFELDGETFFTGIVHDTTERRAIDKALREREQFLAAIVENIPMTLSVKDAKTLEYVRFNKSGEELLGTSRAEILGKTDKDVFADATATVYQASDRAAIAAGDQLVITEETIDTRLRGRRLLRTRKILLPDESGVPQYLLALSEDITSQARAARQLRRMSQALDQSPASVLITDADGTIEYVNRRFVEATGYTIAEVTGQNPRLWKSGVHAAEFYQEMWATIRADGEWHGELCNKKKNGELLWERVAISPLHDDAGKATHYVAIKHDVSGAHAAARALREATEAAEEANRAKSAFLATMSHEIRTPLNAIVGMGHLLRQTELTPRQRDYCAKSEAAAQNLLRLINNVLDFSKIEAGRLDLEAIEFDVDSLLDELANVNALQAQEKGLELVLEVSADVPRRLIGDSLRIQQVLLNLTGNAIKFTATGEVVVTVQLARYPIAGAEVTLAITVRDTGVGMSAEHIANLFQPFRQADSSTTRMYGGTGLGLAISRRLVELMGGTIQVVRAMESGSTFLVQLPLRPADQTGWERGQAPPSLRHTSAVIVDDNASSRGALKRKLASWAIETATAAGATEAVHVLRTAAENADAPLRLVFVDEGLEGAALATIARDVRSLVGGNPVHLVALGRFGAERHCHGEWTWDAYLPKPITTAALRATLAMLDAPKTDRDTVEDRESMIPAAYRRVIRDVSVLLVEDDEINQQVAREILTYAGAKVTVARHGKEAVELIVQSASGRAFDAVLMDMEMPLMDGMEATALIRKDPRFAALPIIAMTAHALGGIREACLAAGMSDYVAKPIDPRELASVLRRWVSPGDHPNQRIAWSRREASAAPPRLECCAVDEERAVCALGGNVDLFRRLLRQFVERFAQAPADIVSALQRGAQDEAAGIAHAIKGVAANLAAERTRAAASALEAALRGGAGIDETEGARETLAAALHEAAALISALPVRDSTAAAPTEPAAPGLPEQALARVSELLARQDFDAQFAAERLDAELRERGIAGACQTLLDRIRLYDYDGAREAFRALTAELHGEARAEGVD